MKKIHNYLLSSLLVGTIILTPLFVPLLNGVVVDDNVSIVNYSKQNEQGNYGVNFSDAKNRLGAPSISSPWQEKDAKFNISADNSMQKVFSFKDKDNNIYNVVQNAGYGLDVYQVNNDKAGELIAALPFELLKSETSKGDPIYPNNITDVVASSDGEYLYLSTPYGNSPGTPRGTNYFSIIWKYNIHTSELTTLLNTRDLKWPSSIVGITSVSAIGVIPSDAGDKLLLIDDYRNNFYGNSDGANPYDLPYVVLDVKNPMYNLGQGKLDHRVFTGSGTEADYVNMTDFFVTKISDGNYKLTTSSRSKSGGNENNKMYINDINFSLNTKNILNFDFTNNKNCYSNDNFGSSGSNATYKVSNLAYDWFNYLTAYPKHFIASWYDLHPLKADGTTDNIAVSSSIGIIDATNAQIGSNFGFTSDTQPYTWLASNLIESDTSLDGNLIYYLPDDSSSIYYTKGSTTSLKNTISILDSINSDYKIPDGGQHIVGFGWADQAKSKMTIYDSNNDIAQYDVTTGKMELIKGLAFKTTNLGNPQYKEPSDLTNGDLKSLFIDDGLYQSGDKMSINKTNVNDQDNSFTLNVVITKKSGDIYKASKNYENFNQPKPKSASTSKTMDTNSWIIIGVIIGVVVVLILTTIYLVVRLKKKTTTK